MIIIMSLSIPGIVLFNTVWIKGGTCPSGTPFGWASAWLKARVTCQPPERPCSARGDFHPAVAAAHQGSPSRCGTLPVPSRFLSLHKTSPNGGMPKAFPALQGGVGREGEHSPPAPSLFLRGLCFLSDFLEFSTFLMMCVLLRRFLSFFPPPQLDLGCKFLSTVQVCAYVHIIV